MAGNKLVRIHLNDGVKRHTVQHEPNSECEQIVYMLATDCKPSNYLKVVDVLCPSCKHALTNLFTT